MTTKTEAALHALVEAIAKVTTPAGYPRPLRNDTIESVLEAIGETVGKDGARINVNDGQGAVSDEALGSDSGVVGLDGYDLAHNPEIEIIVRAREPEERDAIFDAILEMIATAIEADRTLDGTVDHVAFQGPPQRTNLATDGLPYIKACVLTLVLTFTSPRPF